MDDGRGKLFFSGYPVHGSLVSGNSDFCNGLGYFILSQGEVHDGRSQYSFRCFTGALLHYRLRNYRYCGADRPRWQGPANCRVYPGKRLADCLYLQHPLASRPYRCQPEGQKDARGTLGAAQGRLALSATGHWSLSPVPDLLLDGDCTLPLGEITLQVFHTPGHSPGGICIYAEGQLFTGDTLFVGDSGATRLKGGNRPQLGASLRRIFELLPPTTVIHPGHDYGPSPTSTLAWERCNNVNAREYGFFAEPE
jgi:hypothetical protein